jgi:hypothetical protein
MEKVNEDKISIEKDIDNIESKIGDYDSAAKTVASLRQGQSDKKSELKLISKNLKFFKGHDVCPTCTQNISGDFKDEQISGLTQSGKIIAEEIVQFNNDVVGASKIVSEISEQSMKLKECSSNLSALNRDYVRKDRI